MSPAQSICGGSRLTAQQVYSRANGSRIGIIGIVEYHCSIIRFNWFNPHTRQLKLYQSCSDVLGQIHQATSQQRQLQGHWIHYAAPEPAAHIRQLIILQYI